MNQLLNHISFKLKLFLIDNYIKIIRMLKVIFMEKIFKNCKVGKLNLKNRFMRSATAEKLSDENGIPPKKLSKMYTDLSDGGIGLIITGHAYIDRKGKAHSEMSAIDRDSLIEVWSNIIKPIKEKKTKIIMQINHGGGSCDPKITPKPLSPSGISLNKKRTSYKMSKKDINEVVNKFVKAAERVKKAEFDGVQIHAAHGYLLNQFMLPFTNQRQDKWGGCLENRFRIIDIIIKKIRKTVGKDFPIWIKLGVGGKEKFGLSINEGKIFTKMVFESGIDCVEISNASSEPDYIKNRKKIKYLPWAKIIKNYLSNKNDIAVVNGFSSLKDSKKVIDNNFADLVSLCRPLILEPDLINKFKNNQNYKAKCIRCNQCWPKKKNMGVKCYNDKVRSKV